MSFTSMRACEHYKQWQYLPPTSRSQQTQGWEKESQRVGRKFPVNVHFRVVHEEPTKILHLPKLLVLRIGLLFIPFCFLLTTSITRLLFLSSSDHHIRTEAEHFYYSGEVSTYQILWWPEMLKHHPELLLFLIKNNLNLILPYSRPPSPTPNCLPQFCFHSGNSLKSELD